MLQYSSILVVIVSEQLIIFSLSSDVIRDLMRMLWVYLCNFSASERNLNLPKGGGPDHTQKDFNGSHASFDIVLSLIHT